MEQSPVAPESERSALRPPRSSRQRYLKFVADYQARRLEISEGDEKEASPDEKAGEQKQPWPLATFGLKRGKRREYLREYLAWLWPYRYAVIVLAVLALLTAGLEMAEPLFMRFIVDRVLLNTGLESATRLAYLQMAGALFLI